MTEKEKQMEREANQFAMALLMPKSLVRKWIEENGEVGLFDSNKLQKFADDFGVTTQLASIRLSQIQ